MSKAFWFNFSIIKRLLAQYTLLYFVVGVFMGVLLKNVNIAIGVMCVVGPFLSAYILFSYDIHNGWERYCMVLPFGRKKYVLGRCLCILVCTILSTAVAALLGTCFVLAAPLFGASLSEFAVPDTVAMAASIAVFSSALILFSMTCSLPFLFRFGLNKAVRFVPVVMIFLAVLALAAFSAFVDGETFDASWGFLLNSYVLFAVLVAACCLVLYAVSVGVSVKLFKAREL